MSAPFAIRQAADGSYEVLICLPGLERWCGCSSRTDALAQLPSLTEGYGKLLRELDDPAAVPDVEQLRALLEGSRAASEAFARSGYPFVASMLRHQVETLERLLEAL